MAQIAVVITGSTRGLGFCMAGEFLQRGCALMISGRTAQSVEVALASLRARFPGASLHGCPCDTGEALQVQALWENAEEQFGRIDHWINNAGVGQPMLPIWELPPSVLEDIFRTNAIGVLHGVRFAMCAMTKQKHGAIWLVEGHGSDGSIRTGLSVYGASKRAVRYLARALAYEARGTGVVVGALSPGIMITDFTMKQLDRSDPQRWERTKKVFNILADRPETVAAFLVPRILATKRNGVTHSWLTGRKILFRFMTAGLSRRRLIDD
jgi:NAD(P)-dependent dehydrogenase (short-subunit alcohol dehydrogenase family)